MPITKTSPIMDRLIADGTILRNLRAHTAVGELSVGSASVLGFLESDQGELCIEGRNVLRVLPLRTAEAKAKAAARFV